MPIVSRTKCIDLGQNVRPSHFDYQGAVHQNFWVSWWNHGLSWLLVFVHVGRSKILLFNKIPLKYPCFPTKISKIWLLGISTLEILPSSFLGMFINVQCCDLGLNMEISFILFLTNSWWKYMKIRWCRFRVAIYIRYEDIIGYLWWVSPGKWSFLNMVFHDALWHSTRLSPFDSRVPLGTYQLGVSYWLLEERTAKRCTLHCMPNF